MTTACADSAFISDNHSMTKPSSSPRSGGVGYLLKDRVANVGEFVDAIARVAAGGTALDPEVVAGLLTASRHASSLAALTARERDVLALTAEGRSNTAIADLR